MEPIGDYLKREREFRNISLEEISRTTKIRGSILQAIEENQLESIDSLVFVKGFLRAYAKYVGLDPTDVVLRYEASLENEEESPAPKKKTDSTQGQWKARYIVLPISLLVLCGFVLFLLIHDSGTLDTNRKPQSDEGPDSVPAGHTESESSPPPSTMPGTEADRREDDSPLALGSPPSVNPPPVHPQRPVLAPSETAPRIVIELRAFEDTWMQLSIDEGPSEEILLHPGEVISRHGVDNIDMKIGNAGGVELLYNGKDMGRPGESGKVVHLSIGPQDVQFRGRPTPSAVNP
jgi:cytoskeleton protein RodZ